MYELIEGFTQVITLKTVLVAMWQWTTESRLAGKLEE